MDHLSGHDQITVFNCIKNYLLEKEIEITDKILIEISYEEWRTYQFNPDMYHERYVINRTVKNLVWAIAPPVYSWLEAVD